MSIVSKRVSIINDSFQSLKALGSDLSTKLSEIDKHLDRLYHELEHGKYGTVQAHKKLLEIQKARRQRRVIKHEIQRLAPMMKVIENKDFLNQISQIKNTVVMKSEETNSWTGEWGIDLEEVLNYN